MKKNTFVNLFLSSVSAIAAFGCASERVYDDQGADLYGLDDRTDLGQIDRNNTTFGPQGGNLDLSGGVLRGIIGDVTIRGAEPWLDGYADDSYASVYAVVEDTGDGAAMTIIDVIGGLQHADFVVDQPLTFRSEELYRASAAGNLMVSVIGCSTPGQGVYGQEWAYDQNADQVIVTKREPTPGLNVFEYTATFNDIAGQPLSTVSGEFRLDP